MPSAVIIMASRDTSHGLVRRLKNEARISAEPSINSEARRRSWPVVISVMAATKQATVAPMVAGPLLEATRMQAPPNTAEPRTIAASPRPNVWRLASLSLHRGFVGLGILNRPVTGSPTVPPTLALFGVFAVFMVFAVLMVSAVLTVFMSLNVRNQYGFGVALVRRFCGIPNPNPNSETSNTG